MSPEVLVGDSYDESVDIWTIGIILFEMIYKRSPFKIAHKEDLVNILNQPISFDENIISSDEVRDCIEKCLSKRAIDRPNIR